MSTIIDNLFFRQDDGSVLAIRIKPTVGPELLRVLRGLSLQTGPLTQQPALPFAATASTSLDDGLAENAQKISLTSNTSALPLSSAAVHSKKAPTSLNTLASVRGASAALSSKSSPNASTGSFSTDAEINGIFSSADGKPYDRDWITAYNVNEDILKGVPSKHKLDLLVRHGAVVVGDKLCVTYYLSGDPVVLEGEVSPPISFCRNDNS